MDIEGVRRLIDKRVKEAGTQAAFGQAAGVSQAHISEVMNGKAEPSEALLLAIGIEKVVRVGYRRRLTPEQRTQEALDRRAWAMGGKS